MRVIAALLLCLATTGCAIERRHEAKEALNQANAACNQTHPSVRGQEVARAQCLNAARDAYVDAVDMQDMDIEAVLDAKRVQIAEKVDAGTMSTTDARLAFAEANSAAVSEMQARLRQRAETAAAIRASMPAPTFVIPPAAPPLVLPTGQTTCNSREWAPGQIQTTCQ